MKTGAPELYALAVRCTDGEEGIYVINHFSTAVKAELPEGKWKPDGGIRGSGRLAHMTEERSCVELCEAVLEINCAVFEPLSLVYIRKEQKAG